MSTIFDRSRYGAHPHYSRHADTGSSLRIQWSGTVRSMIVGSSNPVPSKHTHLWLAGPARSLVGHRDGHDPIVIARTKPAPMRRITHDKGRVHRTLAGSAGVVTLTPKQALSTKPKTLGNWGTINAYQLAPHAKVREERKALGYSIPKTPSWRHECAGRSDWRQLVLAPEPKPRGDGPIVADNGCGKPQVFRRCSIASTGIVVTVPPLAGQEDTFIGPRRHPIPGIVTSGTHYRRWREAEGCFVNVPV